MAEALASDDAAAAAALGSGSSRRQARRPRAAHAYALSAAEIDGVDEGEEPLADHDPDAFEEHGARGQPSWAVRDVLRVLSTVSGKPAADGCKFLGIVKDAPDMFLCQSLPLCWWQHGSGLQGLVACTTKQGGLAVA